MNCSWYGVVPRADRFPSFGRMSCTKSWRSSRLYEQIVQQVEESIHKSVLSLETNSPERELLTNWRESHGRPRSSESSARKRGW